MLLLLHHYSGVTNYHKLSSLFSYSSVGQIPADFTGSLLKVSQGQNQGVGGLGLFFGSSEAQIGILMADFNSNPCHCRTEALVSSLSRGSV